MGIRIPRLRMFLFLLATVALAACGEEGSIHGPAEGLSPAMATTAAVAFDCSAVSEIPQAECEGLVDFYTALDGPNWTNKTGWLQTTTPCSWFGVSCENGSVNRLNVVDNNLAGDIPGTAIAKLSNLEAFSLANDPITGTIPGADLASLTDLEALNLTRTKLTGSIPSELANLSNLSFLNLQRNDLTGGIPAQLGMLSNLRTLVLARNPLGGSIPSELGNLANLEELNLNLLGLTGEIPPELGMLGQLNALRLAANELTGEIPTSFANLSSLTILQLARNQLSGSLPPELANLSNLGWFWVRGNQFTGNIPPEYGDFPNLRALTISENQLTGFVPAELGNLPTLQYFLLEINGLTGQVPLAVAEVGALTTVECSFSDNDGLFVPDLPEYRALVDADGLICGLALVTPNAALEMQIEAFVATGQLTQGQGTSLLEKLKQAQALFTDETSGLLSFNADLSRRSPNSPAPVKIMDAFIEQVSSFVMSGDLTEEQGEILIDLAEATRNSFG